MKRHSLGSLLLVGLASLVLAACSGGDTPYGGPAAAQDPGFIPVAGIAPPRFAYVVHANADRVSGYKVDATTGALTPMDTIWTWATGSTPSSIAVDPLVKFAYVTNSGNTGVGLANNSISIFTIDNTTGALTAAFTPIPAGVQPISVAIEPGGRYVYVANAGSNTVSAYVRNTTTGALVAVTGSPFALSPGDIKPQSVTVDPSGKFVYVANATSSTVTMFSIDSASSPSLTPGALTLLGSVLSDAHPNSIAVAPSGSYAYVSNETGDSVRVFSISSTGMLAFVQSSSASGSTPTGVAVEPNGRYAYVSQRSTNNLGAYSIGSGGAGLGRLTLISNASIPAPLAAGPTYVAADPAGKFVYASLLNGGGVAGYTIGGTGALTAMSGSPFPADPLLSGTSTSDFILITK
ncbi:beta-propeller fold lactonase family protein [Aquabacterium sp.]|uniref:lactonase family protein n=1 Tax=Aquabacterium sp. TaxID=1872578 RepID=UPI0019ADE627|nr:beta-propeller fold lactonase family protein [Aquabacterium sp.]MBC7700937.1 beta-propeller fold lactonase family protein [Aquabacterium sp.]